MVRFLVNLILWSQARTKALREQQRSRLDGRHKYIINLVALQVDSTDAEVEAMLEERLVEKYL